ncbi:SMI1/KNR4 family protein [Hymenobacter jeollabukensis]|uniref:SMI1/KNR4 family protein n=1 Tax=Hymenobacter jeollabukensis TaxID=2025313 RepID=A0A5R8WWN8_9BACT|nr:SMI1/KNR4 family protein [Hymenobacter jeollabukensis]TLM96928.1 SMI1/KNR4 family protein [Hymenobacter jeollabukensis]
MKDITYIGAPVSDAATFKLLPFDMQSFMLQNNGLIAYYGALHIRGCCQEPLWHSIRETWDGPNAFWRNYRNVKRSDLPFAEDAVGNQFLLRRGEVIFLDAETGEIQPLGVNFTGFIEGVQRFPDKALDLGPVGQFMEYGALLQPGELLAIYPPVCVKSDDESFELTRMPTEVRLHSLAHLYKQIIKLKPGQQIRLRKDY